MVALERALAPQPEVRLPLDSEARFPPECARCAAPDPSSWVTIRASRPSVLGALAGIGARDGERSWRIPHCAPCRARTRRLALLLNLAGFAWFLGAIFLALAITSPLGRPWGVIAALPLVVALSLPLVLWMMFFPPPVDVRVEAHDTVFTFRDPDLADRFRDENGLARPLAQEDSP